MLTELHKHAPGFFVNVLDLLPASSIRVQDGGHAYEDGSLAMVMERGKDDLEKYVMTRNVEHHDLRVIVTRVVSVLDALHSSGLTWMDLKAANFVRFLDRDEDWVWRGIDLDGAMVTGSAVSSAEFMVTPSYMAPELMRRPPGLLAAPSMDMWSLGMLLFRLVKQNCSLWKCLDLNSDEEIIRAVTSKTSEQLQLDVHSVLDQQFPSSRDGPLKRVLRDLLMVNPAKRPSCRDVKSRGLVTGDISFSRSRVYSEMEAFNQGVEHKLGELHEEVDASSASLKSVMQQVDDQQGQINDNTDNLSEVKQILVVASTTSSKNK